MKMRVTIMMSQIKKWDNDIGSVMTDIGQNNTHSLLLGLNNLLVALNQCIITSNSAE